MNNPNWQETFTPEEWSELKAVMNSITHTIPDSLASKVWHWFQRIGKHANGQPCSCQSTARYWIEAVDTIKRYISQQT